VNHRLAQVFGSCIASLAALGDDVSGTIVLYDGRMIDRDVRCALIEISKRVAAGLHGLAYQTIGLDNCTLRIVYKLSLSRLPTRCELLTLIRLERSQLQLLHTLLTFLKRVLGGPSVAGRSDRPIVLGAELATQLFGLPLLHVHPEHSSDGEHQKNQENWDKLISHTELLSHPPQSGRRLLALGAKRLTRQYLSRSMT